MAITAETGIPSPETHAEIAATLVAINIVIARELDVFQQAEAKFEQIARPSSIPTPNSPTTTNSKPQGSNKLTKKLSSKIPPLRALETENGFA